MLIIDEGQVKNKKHGNNFKGKPQARKYEGKKDPVATPPKKKEMVAKDDTFFEFGVVGHWKRNCPTYLLG